jgi:drug/metabolite transporter (DMT)-like permease
MAIFYFAMFCLLRSITYVVVDTLYERQPDMSPWQMFFMRSCMGIGIMSLHLNRRIKKETWDSIECRKSGPLAFKTVGGILTNLIQFSVTKFIPATIISIVANLAPIVVLILAFSFLKEKILKFDVAMIVLTLVGIFTIILGGDDENSDKATPNFPIWVIYIVLFFNPFLSAGGTVAMRKMAKSSDAVVSWYLQWGTLIASVCIILARGESFSIYSAFEFWDWILAFFTGFLSIYSETVRFKALKMHDASALQKLIPLTTMV